METEFKHVHDTKQLGGKDYHDSPGLTTSFLHHPMGAESPGVQSPQLHSALYKAPDSPQVVYSPSQLRKQTSSPSLPTSPRIPVLVKEVSSPSVIQRNRSNSIFTRERSNTVFKDKSSTVMTKFGEQCREELQQFLQNRGFSNEELDGIVNNFHDIRNQLEDGEWVTREEFKKFFGVREQSFSDHLFDVFKQRHKMHNFQSLDFCPSPQVSRERGGLADSGIEMDAINLKDFLCGLLLLQSNDVDKKLRMVFDLYTSSGETVITKQNLKDMLNVSAKENKIILSDEQFNLLVNRIFSKMDVSGTGKIAFDDFKAAFQVTPQHSPHHSFVYPFGEELFPDKFPLELEARPQRTPLNEFLSINTASPTSSPAKPTKPFSWSIKVDEIEKEGGNGTEGIGTINPEFVEREYEESDDKRSRRRSKKFERSETTNYIPQQEVMPKKLKSKPMHRLRTKFHSSGSKYLFIGLFSLVNIAFFAWAFITYALDNAVMHNLGWGVPFARGFAQILKIDTVLLLLPVARSLLTYIRASPLRHVIPLDKNIVFHKLLALSVVVGTIGHWGAHMLNFYRISNASLADLQKLNPSYFKSVPSFIYLNFQTIPGLTGYIMVASLIIIIVFAIKPMRKRTYETFFATHHVFLVFYAALVLHGVSHILGAWEYWKWLAGPAGIYLIDRCVRWYKQRRGVRVLEAKILPGRATMLKMEIPPRNFTYKAGQYIFLNFPTVSRFEWHPFTLTSAPHEDFISVHIRAAGDWTNKVYELCESHQGDPDFKVGVDGPYGSASEHVFSYKHVIMIGAGIGVTPFASVLKRILNRLETEKAMKLEKVHFFWTCREQGAFQWFADILSQLETHSAAKEFLEINTFLTGALAQHDIRSILLWYGLQQEYASSNVDLVTGLSSRTYWGRANYEKIIEYLFNKYPRERVGVFFCGPKPLAHDLRAYCRKYASLNKSTFYFHQEHF